MLSNQGNLKFPEQPPPDSRGRARASGCLSRAAAFAPLAGSPELSKPSPRLQLLRRPRRLQAACGGPQRGCSSSSPVAVQLPHGPGTWSGACSLALHAGCGVRVRLALHATRCAHAAPGNGPAGEVRGLHPAAKCVRPAPGRAKLRRPAPGRKERAACTRPRSRTAQAPQRPRAFAGARCGSSLAGKWPRPRPRRGLFELSACRWRRCPIHHDQRNSCCY